jgi:hypothetical protein
MPETQQINAFRKGCIEGLLIFILIFLSVYIDERRKRRKWSMSEIIKSNVLGTYS